MSQTLLADPDTHTQQEIAAGKDAALSSAYDRHARREDCTTWQYDYNTRSEVTGAEKRQSNSDLVPGLDFGYNYDGLGNRLSASKGLPALVTTYAPDAMNRYSTITSPAEDDILVRSDTLVATAAGHDPAGLIGPAKCRGRRMAADRPPPTPARACHPHSCRPSLRGGARATDREAPAGGASAPPPARRLTEAAYKPGIGLGCCFPKGRARHNLMTPYISLFLCLLAFLSHGCNGERSAEGIQKLFYANGAILENLIIKYAEEFGEYPIAPGSGLICKLSGDNPKGMNFLAGHKINPDGTIGFSSLSFPVHIGIHDDLLYFFSAGRDGIFSTNQTPSKDDLYGIRRLPSLPLSKGAATNAREDAQQ
jgi:hypothetical protein